MEKNNFLIMENVSVSDNVMLKCNWNVKTMKFLEIVWCVFWSLFLCPKGRFSIFGSPGAFAKSRCLAKRSTWSQLANLEFVALESLKMKSCKCS